MRTQRILRSLVLAIGSIALVGVLFMLYAYSEGDLTAPRPTTSALAAARPTLAPSESGTTAPPGEMKIGKEQIPLGGGEHVRHVIYGKDGKVRGEIELARWQPVGEGRNEFEVTQPVIRLRSPSGQVVRITADAGRLVTRSADPRTFDPRSGKLVGNVRISLDRFSDAQREELPPAERDTITPDRLVELRMQDIEFDMEFARVETSGPFEVEAAELSAAGSGLTLDYNELEGRIEELTINERGRIEVRGVESDFALGGANLGGQKPAGAAKATPTPTPSPTPKPSASPSSADEDIPILTMDGSEREHRPRPLDAYTAVFTGDVRIQQLAKNAEVGRLLADRLEILFDFGERERSMTKRAPETDDFVGPPAPKPKTAPSPENRVLVTWTGPLHVTSERLPPPTDPTAREREGRLHLTAIGAPVTVADAERQIGCDKLIYHKETDFVQLFGTPEAPAHVQAESMGELQGPFIELNRRGGSARATGPGGRLVASRAAALAGLSNRKEAPLKVHFEKTFDATFVPVEASTNGVEQKGVPKEALRSATFTGDVALDHGDDRIRCGRLEMDFASDPNHKPYPVQARMFDNARVSEGERIIAARDKLLARFKLIEKEKPPFDLAQARALASKKGRDPDTVDWDAERTKYESRRDFGTVLSSIRADGGVEVRDPPQRLEVTSQTLDCTLADTGEIEDALVTPAAGAQAFVAMGDFSIAAPVPIPFDSVHQTLRVDGPGRMTFPSKQDFDGRQLDKPVLVAVRWSERMEFTGTANRAEFVGAVHVETPDSTYDCGALRVDFRDAPRAAANAAQPPMQWWVFKPVAERLRRKEKREGWRVGPGGETFDKEPVRFYAIGGVKAVNQNLDPRDRKLRSRVLIAGPAMTVDLEKNFVNVDGAGSLLIEDYRPPSRKVPQALASEVATEGVVTPLGRWMPRGSSQTYVAWQQAMRYRYRENVAEFDRDVTLVHSTGSKMKLAGRGAATLPGGEEGRESRLNCQHLHVEFERSETEPAAARAGVNRLSGNEVRMFKADGQVYFFDSDISAIANSINYSGSDNVLQIIGSEGTPAEVYDQRQRFAAMRATRFVWDRATNRIWGPNTQLRIN